eukprot:CAMPEP_0202960818 /NCGR_PEP_ID=MMETSP1396-20130829/4967_1 /ASSEMBLY_ACC=CAM_ASM_000872 /TAXON_ID= /ORGANISM="Pseudokeronopsis sp., Strain Brazil" /LENGTH=73 /DNA_ID=CAMNT_0049680285 /DNA_START=1172 /DNA_END=1393 /DNA_ORIENTATION=-
MTLDYFMMCFNESLRMEVPSVCSTNIVFPEEVTFKNGITVGKNTPVVVLFHSIHHDPDEWQQHDKYIPERFDP